MLNIIDLHHDIMMIMVFVIFFVLVFLLHTIYYFSEKFNNNPVFFNYQKRHNSILEAA